MPRDKDRKRIIRSRMKKTGESYTTARAHVISKTKMKHSPARSVDHAALAGMSDDKIAAKTGRGWSSRSTKNATPSDSISNDSRKESAS
jgi:hypothetical protein